MKFDWKNVFVIVGVILASLFGSEAIDLIQKGGDSVAAEEGLSFAATPPADIPESDAPQLIDDEPNVDENTVVYVYRAGVNCRLETNVDVEVSNPGLPTFTLELPQWDDDYTTVDIRVTNPYVLVRDAEDYLKRRDPCKKLDSEFQSLDYLRFLRAYRK